jgi:hypothetical protein
MTNSRQLVFPQGATVSVLTSIGSTGVVFIGHIIRDAPQRNHEEPIDPFFAIQLTEDVTVTINTTTTTVYSVNEIVALNINSVIAIGPVSIV